MDNGKNSMREKIITYAQKDISDRHLVDDAVAFDEIAKKGYELKFNREMFYERVFAMDLGKTSHWYYDLTGGKPQIFVKKIIRKLVAFMLTPAFNTQNSFNAQTVAAMQEIAGYINQCEERIEKLEQEIEELRKNSR